MDSNSRAVNAALVSALFTPVICFFTNLLLTGSVFHPFASVTGSVLMIINLYSWPFIVILSFLSVSVVYFHFCHYSLNPLIFENNLSVLQSLLKINSIFKILLHGVCSSIAVCTIFSILSGQIPSSYISLTTNTNGSQQLNSHHIFIIIYGFFVGVALYLKYVIEDYCYVQIPIIDQEKFTRFKLIIVKVLHQSFRNVLRHLHFYYVLYYLLGSSLEALICSLLNIKSSPNTLSAFSNMLDFQLLVATISTGLMLMFTYFFALEVMNMFLVEPEEFQLEMVFQKSNHNLLQNVLTGNQSQLVKYLAFQNFSKIAQFSKDKRKQLFCLSQPGGHPTTWNTIAGVCLKKLEDLSRDINAAQNADTQQPSEKIGSEKSFLKYWNITIRSLKSKSVFMYFTRRCPRYGVSKCLSQCQPSIWIIEGLSHLVVRSYSEDNYGVVQQHIARIISVFLSLYQSLELLQKSGLFVKKKGFYSSEVKISLNLKQTINCALWRITEVFKNDLSYITLEPQHRRLLQKFIELRS